PSNSAFLFSTTWRTRSSIAPFVTKCRTWTLWRCPIRCTRPMRCSSVAGFHGTSRLTTTEAASCRLSPSPPASVENRTRAASAGPSVPPPGDAPAVPPPPVEERLDDVVGEAQQALPLAEDEDLRPGSLQEILEDVGELLELRRVDPAQVAVASGRALEARLDP